MRHVDRYVGTNFARCSKAAARTVAVGTSETAVVADKIAIAAGYQSELRRNKERGKPWKVCHCRSIHSKRDALEKTGAFCQLCFEYIARAKLRQPFTALRNACVSGYCGVGLADHADLVVGLLVSLVVAYLIAVV